jgi:hypothetical protein
MTEFIAGRDVHAYQQSAALALATRPPTHMSGKMAPTPKVEIPDTEIGTLGDLEGFLQCRKQWFFYVVEDSWHRASPALWLFAFAGAIFLRPASTHPIVHLGNLEFPEAADAVGRQSLCIDPPVDRVSPDTKMFCNLLDGYPWLSHFRTPSTLKWKGQNRTKSQRTQLNSWMNPPLSALHQQAAEITPRIRLSRCALVENSAILEESEPSAPSPARSFGGWQKDGPSLAPLANTLPV